MANQYLPGVTTTPSMLLITDMTRDYPMVITFTVPATSENTYIEGQAVRLTVPSTYGMFQANGIIAKILSVASTTMTVDVDSRQFDAFVDGSATKSTPASLAPAGSRNLQYNNDTNDVPFRSFNNQGN